MRPRCYRDAVPLQLLLRRGHARHTLASTSRVRTARHPYEISRVSDGEQLDLYISDSGDHSHLDRSHPVADIHLLCSFQLRLPATDLVLLPRDPKPVAGTNRSFVHRREGHTALEAQHGRTERLIRFGIRHEPGKRKVNREDPSEHRGPAPRMRGVSEQEKQ